MSPIPGAEVKKRERAPRGLGVQHPPGSAAPGSSRRGTRSAHLSRDTLLSLLSLRKSRPLRQQMRERERERCSQQGRTYLRNVVTTAKRRSVERCCCGRGGRASFTPPYVRSFVRPVFLLRRATRERRRGTRRRKASAAIFPDEALTREIVTIIITITRAYQDAETWLRRRGQGLDSALEAQCMIKRERERRLGRLVGGWEGEEGRREQRDTTNAFE